MRWSLHGAHVLMQVRTAALNGELRDRLRAPVSTARTERAFDLQTQATPLARRLTPEKLPVSSKV